MHRSSVLLAEIKAFKSWDYLEIYICKRSKGSPILPPNSAVLEKFIDEGKKRKLDNCELLKYQQDYKCNELLSVSMHQLVLTYKEECCDLFLSKMYLTN
jgi:hypothetical protein